MKPVADEALLKQLNWRYAVKKFDPTRKVSAQDWDTLEKSLILTPSSFGLQPWHFVVVTSQDVKNKLTAASWGQSQVSDASHVVVLAAKKGMDAAYVDTFLRRTSEVRGVPFESLDGYRKMILGLITGKPVGEVDAWSARQVYIAAGTLLTAAAMLGIDTCPLEGIDPAKYDQILGLDQKGYTTLMIVTLGYRAADDHYSKLAKVRFPADDVVTHIA